MTVGHDSFDGLDESFDVWLAGFVRQTFGGEGPCVERAAIPDVVGARVEASAEPTGDTPSSPPVLRALTGQDNQ